VRPEDVLDRYPPDKVQITVKDDGDVVVVEGDSLSLTFLAELIAAQATAVDCGIELSPTGAGSAYFGRDSNKGLCFHRSHDVEPEVVGGEHESS
jgi:hypothetical protein